VASRLRVWWDGDLVGELDRGGGGAMYFQYDASWLGRADARSLSISLPLDDALYAAPARNWFANLLPEGAAREAIARRRMDVSGRASRLTTSDAARYAPNGMQSIDACPRPTLIRSNRPMILAPLPRMGSSMRSLCRMLLRRIVPAVAVVLAACSTDIVYPVADVDLTSPAACLSGVLCAGDADCPPGAHCNAALDPPACMELYCGTLGMPCDEDALCTTSLVCGDSTCAECNTANDCDGDDSCVDHECRPVAGVGQPCESSLDCPDGLRCGDSTGACTASDALTTGEAWDAARIPGWVGRPCGLDSDCQAAEPAAACMNESLLEGFGVPDTIDVPGGLCVRLLCTIDAECGVNGACVDASFLGAIGSAGICVRTCDTAADCRRGDAYGCAPRTLLGGGDGGACVSSSMLASVCEGQTCGE
jgi:HipA-like protein